LSRESLRAPVLSFSLAAEFVFRQKAGGRTVVFTNGCFDLLHPGHVEILEKACEMGDVLAVGLNSDESVKRLKGPSRPLQNLESRAAVLSCIRFVDCVIPFDEDTPLKLISLLLPDILVKGGDYSVSSVVGSKIVISNGGRVEIVPLLKGHSTTGIIQGME